MTAVLHTSLVHWQKDSRIHCLLFTLKATKPFAGHMMSPTWFYKLILVSGQNRKIHTTPPDAMLLASKVPIQSLKDRKTFPTGPQSGDKKKLDRSSRILLNKCKQNSSGIPPAAAKSTREIDKTQAFDYSKYFCGNILSMLGCWSLTSQ